MKAAQEAELEATLAVLADPVRRKIVDLLSGEKLQASIIAAECDLSPQALSRHLRTLREAGLIEHAVDPRNDDARVRIYQIRREPLQHLRAWLDELESLWVAQFTGFREHVEAHVKRRKPPQR